jgi:uncharacterized protein
MTAMLSALLLLLAGVALVLAAVVLADGLRLTWRQLRRSRYERPLRLRVCARQDWDGEHFVVRLRSRFFTPLARYAPGQYLTLLARPGAGPPVRRSYSLAGWRRRPLSYELGIKREAEGRVSRWLYAHLQPGREIEVLPPAGEFVLANDHRQGEQVLIGGGIGITPLRAMLQAMRAAGSQYLQAYLWHSVRHSAALGWRAEWEALAADGSGFHYHPRVTGPDPGWTGARGRLQADEILAPLRQPARAQFYLCASDAMMQALITGLQARGIEPAQIHFESFGARVLNSDPQCYRIRLAGHEPFELQGAPSLLYALEEAGIAVPASCRAGNCGECRLRLLCGEVRTLVAPAVPVPAGCILACCSLPRSDLELALP